MDDQIKENFFNHEKDEILKIHGREIILEEGTIDHTKLKLWPGNPRIIHKAELHENTLDQEEIEQALKSSSKIKDLKKLIEKDGAINEPILVSENNWEVYEGNRRLLVNRILYAEALKKVSDNENNPWQYIKVQIVPKDTELKLIDSYLGTLHLVGKEDWDSYNKAAFLAREKSSNNYSMSDMANIHKDQYSLQEIRKSVNTYNFMRNRNHTKSKDFSVFELLESNTTFKKERAQNSKFDDFYYQQQIQGKFPQALDVRRFLPEIIKSPNRQLKKQYFNGDIDWDEAIEILKESKSNKPEVKKIDDFKAFINDPKTKRTLLKIEDKSVKDDMVFNLEKIWKAARNLVSDLEK